MFASVPGVIVGACSTGCGAGGVGGVVTPSIGGGVGIVGAAAAGVPCLALIAPKALSYMSSLKTSSKNSLLWRCSKATNGSDKLRSSASLITSRASSYSGRVDFWEAKRSSSSSRRFSITSLGGNSDVVGRGSTTVSLLYTFFFSKSKYFFNSPFGFNFPPDILFKTSVRVSVLGDGSYFGFFRCIEPRTFTPWPKSSAMSLPGTVMKNPVSFGCHEIYPS